MSKKRGPVKSRPNDPDLTGRYGNALIAPFAILVTVIAVFKVIFAIFKPKSTLKQMKKN